MADPQPEAATSHDSQSVKQSAIRERTLSTSLTSCKAWNSSGFVTFLSLDYEWVMSLDLQSNQSWAFTELSPSPRGASNSSASLICTHFVMKMISTDWFFSHGLIVQLCGLQTCQNINFLFLFYSVTILAEECWLTQLPFSLCTFIVHKNQELTDSFIVYIMLLCILAELL